MRLPDGHGGAIQVSFIDVPGHHAFVRNMLAGTGGIDCAVLVIAADEGVKAQTEEHVAICSLLGIERGIVVLTKMDAVDKERLEHTRQHAILLLKDTFLRDAPMFAVSAMTGEGLPELRDALANLAASVPARSHDRVPRLYPDRAFSMRGFGTVVTGTLQSGKLRVGSAVTLEPGAHNVKVRGMQVHGASADSVAAPCRVALNLTGIEPRQVTRGQSLTPADALIPTTLVDAEISLLPGTPPLKHRARLRFHAFTADIGATVLLYDREILCGAASALVRLKLENPVVLVPGDRFVLRVPSPASTIGGGRVLDTVAVQGMRKAEALRWLQQLKVADREKQLELRIERRGSTGVSVNELMQEAGLRVEAIQEIIATLANRGLVVTPGREELTSFAVAAGALSKIETTMLAQIAQAKNGFVSRAELRSRSRLNERVFELAVNRLAHAAAIEGGDLLALAGHAGDVDERLKKNASAIEREYLMGGIAPPLLGAVAERLSLTPAEMRDAMTLLLRSKRLIRLGSDLLYIHCETVAKLNAKLAAHRGEAFDVARFKSFTGLTRKHAIPLLEYLDRAHITRNVAGTRIVA
jgi:selenocysteine-specific elongation factor